MDKRLHLFFTGRVQGVGFRFTAKSLALSYSLKGWVCNLADGRVELMVQGPQETIGSFLEDLSGQFRGYITDKELRWLEPSNQLGQFRVKF
jgi:acylphosphatase